LYNRPVYNQCFKNDGLRTGTGFLDSIAHNLKYNAVYIRNVFLKLSSIFKIFGYNLFLIQFLSAVYLFNYEVLNLQVSLTFLTNSSSSTRSHILIPIVPSCQSSTAQFLFWLSLLNSLHETSPEAHPKVCGTA